MLLFVKYSIANFNSAANRVKKFLKFKSMALTFDIAVEQVKTFLNKSELKYVNKNARPGAKEYFTIFFGV